MDENEPKPHVLALRRFLLSSSSSSTSSSPARVHPDAREGGNAAQRLQRRAQNTSSVSSLDASSAATSARNFSHHSTPPQTRLQYTVEKAAAPVSPSPLAKRVAAGDEDQKGPAGMAGNISHAELRRQQRRSISSDSVESQDYVDKLASSAFQDCHSATRTLQSMQPLLSFTEANPSLVRGNTDGRSPSREEDVDVDPPPEDEEEEAKVEGPGSDSEPAQQEEEEVDLRSAHARHVPLASPAYEEDAEVTTAAAQQREEVQAEEDADDAEDIDVNAAGEEDVDVAAETFYSPLTVTEAEDGKGQEEIVPDENEVRDEVALSVPAVANPEEPLMETPPSLHLAQPLPRSPNGNNEEPSLDTTSSSRHQVGVWKAIYGKEKWAGPRRSFSQGEEGSEEVSSPHTEERQRSFVTAAAEAAPAATLRAPSLTAATSASTSASDVVRLASVSDARRADATQWAATRKTALELLRAQLDGSHESSREKPMRATEQLSTLSSKYPVFQSEHVDEPTIVEAVVEEHPQEVQFEDEGDETEQEEPFEIVEVQQGEPASPHVIADVTPADTNDGANEKSRDAKLVDDAGAAAAVAVTTPYTGRAGFAVSANRQRRTAEDILDQLFGGAPPPEQDALTEHCASHCSATTEVRNSQVTSPLKSTPFRTTGAGHLVVRPALSAEVSGISPIKNEAPSILADLYDTPEALRVRPARTPLSTTTPTSGVPYEYEARQRRGRRDSATATGEGREDAYTLDLSAMDFRTAQTLPTSTPSSVMSDEAASMQPDVLYQVAHATVTTEGKTRGREEARRHRTSCRDEEDADVFFMPAEASTQSNSASALRPDSTVSVFPATVPNAWDVARVNKWRAKEQPGHDKRSGAATVSGATAAQGVPVSAEDSSGNNNASSVSPAAALRQERVRQEMRAKELAECTFQPTLSPGTRAMVRAAQEREVEKALEKNTRPPPTLSGNASWIRGTSTATHTATAARTASVNQGARRVPAVVSGQESSLPTIDPRTLKATLQNVYERLYPVELSAAASRRQILDQEMEYRRLAREELILLRRRAGVVVRRVPRHRTAAAAAGARDTFDNFMSNLLRTDWSQVAAASRTTTITTSSGHAAALDVSSTSALRGRPSVASALPSPSVVETSYMSPMAVALLEEREVKRQYNARREAEMQLSQRHNNEEATEGDAAAVTGEKGGAAAAGHSDPAGHETAGSAENFRIALFDEFLLRQNAYYFHRARAVRELERKLTPAFTPTTTQRSTRLVQAMVSRSLLNESMGPETSSLLQQRQRQHIPTTTASLITQHQSPYRDPCTFTPQLSPAARAAKAAERSHRRQQEQHGSPNTQTPSVHRKAFFERLYGDHDRMSKERAKAQEAAAAEEMVGVTFKPQLNGTRNAQVRSVLDPQNYEQYQQYLQKKKQSLEEQRLAQVEKSGEAEEVVCTFRPQTTKTPAYISKMAKSFGVLRQQDTEF